MAHVKTQFQTTIKVLRIDNRIEFYNEDVNSFLQELGIFHQTTCVYTPPQNGWFREKEA